MRQLPLITLLLVFTQLCFAKPITVEETQYANIFAHIESLGRHYGHENVLVVFDVDDTLIVTKDCEKKDGSLTRGAQKYYHCPSFHTEEITAANILKLQKEGYATFALTARSNSLIASTQRELKRKHLGLPTFSFQGTPFTQNFDQVLVPKTKRCKKGQTPPCLRPGEFSTNPKFIDGVMYANNTNKGLALQSLLNKLGVQYQAIVFVDDRAKNIKHLAAAYKDTNIDMTLFLYLRHRH